MIRQKIWFFTAFLLLFSCQKGDDRDAAIAAKVNTPDSAFTEPELGVDGKVFNAPQLDGVYQKKSLDNLPVPIISTEVLGVLEQQLQLLENPRLKRNYRIGDLRIHMGDLRKTIEILKSRQHTLPLDLNNYLDAYQIWGSDRRGHVRFTGYFTPLVQVSHTMTEKYKYPIYSRPKDWEGPLPTRREIEQDSALYGLGLELAYAANKVDIYYMQVQGSGFVEYPDGTRRLLSYDGTNRHPYRSIEKFISRSSEMELSNLSIDGIKRYLQERPELVDTVLFYNPSYTFFNAKRRAEPIGAGTVPLTAGYSIAVDRRYVPLGSCLLAAFPIYDNKLHRVTHYEYRLLMAQDVGGAIKGPGHVDYYFGIGDQAKREAGYLNHYGQLWLLLPKRQIGPVFTSF